MTTDRDDLRRLHFINALFAHVTAHDLYLPKQIQAAITFSRAALQSHTALPLASPTPLFARAEIMAGLQRLARFRESTLLVTNLRPALIPPGHRATPRRKRDYVETLAFIHALVAARTVPNTDLQLLFL